jgi:TonB family protein
MEPFTFYLIKSVIWLTGFSLIYILFLRNERFFRIKRLYLITGIFASFLFPLMSFHYNIKLSGLQTATLPALTSASDNNPVIEAVSSGINFNFKYILLFVYICGMIIIAVRIIRQMRELYGIIRKNESTRRGPARIIRVPELKSPFSFFNYVFINPSFGESDAEQILNHEEVHVQQKHWFDLLLAEIVRMLQWVNPFAWIYTSFIRQNHEYLADEVALRRTSDPAVYRAVLLNQMFNIPVITLSNSFSYSTSKKRFDMMKKIISSPWRKLRILFVLPVIAVIFYAFATPEYHYSASERDGIVKGKVINEESKPMFGVTVSISDGSADVFTDQDGNFTITRVSDGSALVFTYSGYKSLKLKADFSQVMIVKMTKDPDVIPPEFKYVPPVKPTPPKPLLIIDGVEIERGFESLDPNSINTISILKDQTATAVFGEKGKNGVIVVTLKKGASLKQPPPAQQTQQSKQQRPELLVVIDGVITDKKYYDAQKELGYNYGITNRIMGKEATDKYGEKGTNGVYEIITRKKALEMGLKPPFPRLAPDDVPTFQGASASSFDSWVISQVKYPVEAVAKGVYGRVYVNLTVELDGSLSNIKLVNSPNSVLSEEILRVVKYSPKWDPPKNPAVDEAYKYDIAIKFQLPDNISDGKAYVVVEKMPLFPGGDRALLDFIKDNTHYPDSAKAKNIQGKVILRFIVNPEGGVEDVMVLKGVHPLLDEEAIRIVHKLPAFTPGYQGDRPVNVYYMVPITFTLK